MNEQEAVDVAQSALDTPHKQAPHKTDFVGRAHHRALNGDALRHGRQIAAHALPPPDYSA